MNQIKFFALFLLYIVAGYAAFCQNPREKKRENIVYGMVSGTALLMDEYIPVKSNHKAILFIPGSAWGFVYPQHYDQTPLKDDVTLDSGYIGKCVRSLVQNGYTIFVVNHRFAPKFQYRDIIDDCQRSVRYIRYHAKEFDIDPDHIGSMGLSSGANLASMLGVTDNNRSVSKSPVDSVSSKVQAVVTLAAPFNLADFKQPEDTAIANNFVLSALVAYMGSLPAIQSGSFALSGKYLDASPLAFVTRDAAPTLIYYSDNDPVIPVRQAKAMSEKLRQNNVAVKAVEKHNERHSPIPDMTEVCKWFENYLK